MKLGSMVLCLLSAAVGSMGVVEGASLVYDANINKLVLNMTTFPTTYHHNDKRVLFPRASVSNRDFVDGKANEHHL